jgi:GH24 family phage-related lysozyme (muramidase)
MGLTSCTKEKPQETTEAVQYIVKHAPSKTTKLLSLLERGDAHSVFLKDAPKDKRVIKLDELSKYAKTDSLGELFYQVYVGKADKAIRKARGKKGDLLTVGQGITGKRSIRLAGGLKAKEGDYISATSVDSMLNLEVARRDSVVKSNVSESVYNKLKPNEKDAILSYLYNVNESILKKSPKGKSFFQYLNEGNKGMVQSKFNIRPSSDVAATGLAKRNLVQMLVFGDGKIYENKEAQENFKQQVKIVKSHKSGNDLLKETFDIVRAYGVNEENLAKTEKMTFEK